MAKGSNSARKKVDYSGGIRECAQKNHWHVNTLKNNAGKFNLWYESISQGNIKG